MSATILQFPAPRALEAHRLVEASRVASQAKDAAATHMAEQAAALLDAFTYSDFMLFRRLQEDGMGQERLHLLRQARASIAKLSAK
jgi:hypothetical protein